MLRYAYPQGCGPITLRWPFYPMKGLTVHGGVCILSVDNPWYL